MIRATKSFLHSIVQRVNGRVVFFRSTWMGNLPEKLHDLPLNQLAIPGSHDSTTFFLDKSMDGVIGWLRFGNKVTYNWAKTQNLRFSEQLEAGIRYLDLRVSTRKGKQDLYLLHTMYSHTVQHMATEVNTYLEQNPKEVVLLDFNHLYDMSIDHHKELVKMLTEVFGKKMCPYPVNDLPNATIPSLNTLWEKQYQVVAFYYDAQNSKNLNNFKIPENFWPGHTIVSHWANTSNTDDLIKFLDKNYAKVRDMKQFHVTQGILTPGKKAFLLNFHLTLKKVCSDQCGRPVVEWIEGKEAGEQNINVCILDFVDEYEYIPAVLHLNQKLAEKLA